MKKLLTVFALLTMIAETQAQDIQTLAGRTGKPKTFGAYGHALGTISAVNGDFAVFTGAYGGVFLNKKWLLGAGAKSLANNVRLETPDRPHIGFWYTGAVAEYVHNTDKLFHWSAGALVGGGSVSERDKTYHTRDLVYASSAVVVAEPFVQVEMNVTHYLRVVAGGSYRRVFGAGGVNITNDKLSAPGFSLGVKAGLF
ncbi:hypothetical protein WJU16_04005 [Chitinophaga pollutisoli]|uniref:Outer membrane protein beta-barrel domain-containing protein n=1 Tax=Chitinophaga pollutisoli TaxID=3133966 RepID=A0ABZ2YSH3_9BACT